MLVACSSALLELCAPTSGRAGGVALRPSRGHGAARPGTGVAGEAQDAARTSGPRASAGRLLLLLGGLRRLATAFRVQLLPHDLGVQDRDAGRSWRFPDARDGNGFNEARVRPRRSGPTHSRRRREAKFARQEADAGRHFCPSTGRGVETRGPTARRPAPGPLPGSAASRLRTRAP